VAYKIKLREKQNFDIRILHFTFFSAIFFPKFIGRVYN